MFNVDTSYVISDIFHDKEIDCSYVSTRYHRNGDPQKSQWTISIEEELLSFATSQENKWYDDDKGWGIHPTGALLEVGKLKTGEKVLIARFQKLGPTAHNQWHGYPADIRGKTHDIPNDFVLTDWKNKKIILNHQFSKIRRGIL